MYWRTKILATLTIILLLGSIVPIILQPPLTTQKSTEYFSPSSNGNQVPLRRISFVAPNPNSYIDEFAYISAISSSVFTDNGTQYISPLIYSSGSESESWFLNDWTDYLNIDGGLTYATSIGDFSESYLTNMQYDIGRKIYPRITGNSSAEIAAKIAVSDWQTSDIAVISYAKDDFPTGGIVTGNISHTFLNDASEIDTFSRVVSGLSTPTSISFTPPSWAGWLEGSFNWTGNELLTHDLIDPNGDIVDYSVFRQVYFSRNTLYVDSPVPLHFWIPKTTDGLWTMNITTDSSGSTSIACTVIYHPGFTQTVSVPFNAKWLNVTLNWDNVATDLNLALVDPIGRLVSWAPAGSILANPGRESIQLPYPMEGDWTIIASWMSATDEQNNINIGWRISQLPTNIQDYFESASNAAVLASLLNAPLLYVEPSQVPEPTQLALDRLGVTEIWLIDIGNLGQASLITQLNTSATIKNLNNWASITGNITELSGASDIVITVPTGDKNEFFGPAAYSAAVHGSPIFSISDSSNQIITRAQETWAPYLIGPEINNIYVVNKYENRAENGWFDERIPNKYSMMETLDNFEAFLASRGALNVTVMQPCVIVAPVSLLPVSFDRSLQCNFHPGRIPGESPAISSILINRGLLHRYLFLTADSSNKALVSMYAYTDGEMFLDNLYHSHQLYQIENTTDALETEGFTIESHVGFNEVFTQLNSQVALWSLSTHGTLTVLPRDPPDRPNGVGYFSMRTTDAPYGFEDSLSVRESPSDPDRLVNPVGFSVEASNHVLKSAYDLDAAIGNIGSPIIILTACLLGGTKMPLMLMEHGAVAVTASPRTVYFRAAGMLSVFLAQSLSQGDNVGEALSNGLFLTSSDYENPPASNDPVDYANQQVLFGDPTICLYEPSASPHVAALDSTTEVFGSHTPSRGIAHIVALGVSAYLPDALSQIGVDFDYYENSNFSDFVSLVSLRYTVIVEPSALSSFNENFTEYADMIETFVRSGGVFAVIGVTDSLSWSPWPILYSSSGSGSILTLLDDTHPLLSFPNQINETTDYNGHFSSIWSNLTVLAEGGSDAVIIAGSCGSGKIVFTTTNPTGLGRDAFIENIVEWNSQPSIILRTISQSQSIIWAGDNVIFTIQLSDLEGNPIESADVNFWLNSSELAVVELGQGFYTITVSEEWTTNNLGTFDVRIYANKDSHDTLSIVLTQYLFVRPYPWVLIGILIGGVAIGIIGWAYIKRRKGEPLFSRERDKDKKSKQRDKEAEQRRREQDAKFDAKEYFGI